MFHPRSEQSHLALQKSCLTEYQASYPTVHLANQSSGKLESYPRVHVSRQAIPDFNGGTPQIKGKATDPRKGLESREAEQRGMLGQEQSRI